MTQAGGEKSIVGHPGASWVEFGALVRGHERHEEKPLQSACVHRRCTGKKRGKPLLG